MDQIFGWTQWLVGPSVSVSCRTDATDNRDAATSLRQALPDGVGKDEHPAGKARVDEMPMSFLLRGGFFDKTIPFRDVKKS